jgi:RNA polymerase sigma-70 factor (ECF subfamily)
MEKTAASLSDESLVRRVLAGETRAFDPLVERHLGMVFAIACARLGDRDRAEDLTQEVFLRAFLALDSLHEPRLFAAWLSRIARNLASHWLRRDGSTARMLPLVALDGGLPDVPDTRAEGVREQMETAERDRAVWEAVLTLGPEEREAVLLHFTEGLNATDIARRLGVHQTTITRRLQRALANMRGLLEPVLREAAPALRAPRRLAPRTLGAIAAAAALSATAKATLAAKATQEVSMLSQAPAAATGLWELLTTSLITGGKIMATGKGIAVTAALAALIGGGIYVTTRSQPTQPTQVAAAAATAQTTPSATGPTVEIIGPGQTPTPVPRLDSMPDVARFVDWGFRGGLADALAQGRFPRVPANATLRVRGAGAARDSFQFGDWNLSSEREFTPLRPQFNPVGGANDAWDVTFDRPLTGQILVIGAPSSDPANPLGWLAAVEGAPAPDRAAIARHDVSTHQLNMRTMSVALGSYALDWNVPPPSVPPGDPRNVNASDPLSAQMPGLDGPGLTTPVAYTLQLLPDFFSSTGRATFAYERFEPGDPWQGAFGSYVLFSPGPDRDWDLQFLNAPGGPPADAAARVANATYDPTNGGLSSGDLVLGQRAAQQR